MAGYSSAQPFLLNKKVSLQIREQSIPSAISLLSKETGVRFSYDPDIFASNQKITLHITSKPLSEVLQLLFNNPSIQFREIGNQIVIFRKTDSPSLLPPPESGKSQQSSENPKASENKIPLTPDTVYIPRVDTLMIVRTDTLTIYKTETIVLHDTIIKTDTVYLYKTQKPGKSLFPDFEKNSMKNRKFREQNGWYGGIAFEQLLGSPKLNSDNSNNKELLDILSSSYSPSPMNFSIQAMAGYDYYRIGLQSGLGFTRIGENFDYSFTMQVGGYFKTDTVEQYYTVNGIDTAWYYITDSSYVGIDYKNYSYKNPNAYKYIEIPLQLKLRLIQNESFNIYLSGGIIGGVLIGQKALIINPEDDHAVGWTSGGHLKSLLLSWKAGIGADYTFTGGWSVFAEFSYRNHLNSVYDDYPLEKKFGLINMKTGIFVRL
jgi:hypothetical protein